MLSRKIFVLSRNCRELCRDYRLEFQGAFEQFGVLPSNSSQLSHTFLPALSRPFPVLFRNFQVLSRNDRAICRDIQVLSMDCRVESSPGFQESALLSLCFCLLWCACWECWERREPEENC